PEVLELLKNESRLIWMTINGNAQVEGYDGKLLTIGFDNDGARNTVQMRGGERLLAAGFRHVLGIQPELDLLSRISGGGSPKVDSRAPTQHQPPTPPHMQEQARQPDAPVPPAAPPPTQQRRQPQSPPQSGPQSPSESQNIAPQHTPAPNPGETGWGSGTPNQ